MKSTYSTLAAIGLAAALASPAGAAVTLLTDNFDTVTSFTASPNADHGGLLAGSTYTSGSGFTGAGHNNANRRGLGNMELCYDGTTSSSSGRIITNATYISFANTHNTAIQFSFDYDQASADWLGFVVGTETAWMNSGDPEFSALFRNNGTGSKWVNSNSAGNLAPFTGQTTIKLELRGSDGGSAFDGAGSVAQLWAGTTDLGTHTLEQLTATNGKFAFVSWDGAAGNGAKVDNFSITATIPEPSAAALGLLATGALLLRRRRD